MKIASAFMAALLLLAVAAVAGCASTQPSGGDGMKRNSVAVFDTNMGAFSVQLWEDKLPITTANFIKLAKQGFYNNTIFHRVISGFMIQGGDPTGTGSGGPGYAIKDEFVNGSSNLKYTIAMANTGQPDSGGSQFFINLADNTYLDWDKQPMTSRHPVFGKVVSGMDVVEAIGAVATGPADKPVQDVVIRSIRIE